MPLICLVSCQPKTPEQELVTVPVSRETIVDKIDLIGRVEAAKQATIMSPDDLSVLELKVKNAEKVAEGDVLCRLDTSKIIEQIRKADQSLDQNASKLTATKIRLEGLRKDLNKNTRLFNLGAVSADDKDKSKQDYEILANDFNTIENEGKNLLLDKRALEKQADLLELKSPFAGTITYIWTSKDTFIPGSSIKKGDLLFKISSEGKMVANITLREQDIVDFNKGQKLKLRLTALPDEKFEGEIINVDTAATIDKDSGVASFKITVEFDPAGKVRPGMEVRITHLISEKKNVLSLPLSAVHFRSAGVAEAYVVEKGKKRLQPLKIGLIGNSNVEILEGLSENQNILVKFE